MIKTLKILPKAVAKVSKPQVQPVSKISIKGGKTSIPSKAIDIPRSNLTNGVKPFKFSKVNYSLTDSIASVTNSTKIFLLPTLLPKLFVQASYLLSANILTGIRSPIDSFKQSSTKFSPYESLTGISSERPEIVMLSQFQQLYDTNEQATSTDLTIDDRFSTPAGRFFEAQAQIRYIRVQNIFKMLSTVEKTPEAQADFKARSASFKDAIMDLGNVSNQMLSVISRLEDVKKQLDLRHDIHVVTPEEIKALDIGNYVGKSTTHANIDQTTISQKFDIGDVLSRFGFKKSNLLQYYASTKIWLQLLYEFKQICHAHSLLLTDADVTPYKKDTSPVFLVKPNTGRFVIRSDAEIFDIETMGKIQSEQVDVVIDNVDSMYKKLYNNVKFKTSDIKIATLAWMLSKEYRFSNALGLTSITNALTSYYRYNISTTNTGNQQLFDFVIGQFGNDIADISTGNGNSLVDMSQIKPDANTAVLTFEEKYITGDNGTTTPGSVYYVDSVLNVDDSALTTSRLNDLATRLENAYKNWLVMSNGMNLMMKFDTLKSSPFHGPLSNPSDLFIEIANTVVDFTSGYPLKQVSNDKLAAVFAAASSSKGNRLKAALFTLIMCRLSRSYGDSSNTSLSKIVNVFKSSSDNDDDNTPATDKIIEDTLTALESSIQSSVTSVSIYVKALMPGFGTKPSQVDVDQTITEETLRSALKSGSYLLDAAETLMKKIMSTFDNDAFLNGRSRFGGYQNTIILMAAFDLIVNIFGGYANQKFVGKYTAHNSTTFLIDKTKPRFTQSINDVTGRLGVEIQLTQQSSFAITNTLKRLSDSTRSTVSFIESPSTISSVGAITKILDDEKLVNMLMNRQQLLMLINNVDDMKLGLSYTSPDLKVASGGDSIAFSADGDKIFDYDDQIRIFDDGVVSPKTKTAIEGLLKTPDYTTFKAGNKKILTVGIPLGFTEKLKQKTTISKATRNSFSDKQEDIVNICVYKVDLENPDVIYKPLKFPFELSRFPVRISEMHPTFKDSLDEYVNKFPTRDYTQVFETSVGSANPIQYLVPGKTETGTFSDDSYAFLNDDMKRKIVQNHVVSFLLETYTHLMSGLSISENSFEMIGTQKFIDESFAETLVTLQLAETNKRVKEKTDIGKTQTSRSDSKSRAFFVAANPFPKESKTPASLGVQTKNSTKSEKSQAYQAPGMRKSSDTIAISTDSKKTRSVEIGEYKEKPASRSQQSPQKAPTIAAEIQKITDRSLPIVLQQFKTIDEFTRMISPLADGLRVSQKILSPKQFDRVFTMVVDPDDFEIDYDETVSTPQGHDALNQLISLNDVVSVTENDIAKQRQTTTKVTTIANRSVKENTYKFRDRDKTSGDAVFEKYFVVIETQGSETV